MNEINRNLLLKNSKNEIENFFPFDNFFNKKKLNLNLSLDHIDLKSIEQSNKKIKTFSTSKKSNYYNSPHYSIVLGKYYSYKKENCSYNKINNISFTSKKLNFSSFSKENTSKMHFLGKKKKILSSEEIELEKIKREKEEIKKQKILHEKCYLRSKNYISNSIYLSNNNSSKNLRSKILFYEKENKKELKINQNIENNKSENKEKYNMLENNKKILLENNNEKSLIERIEKYYQKIKEILNKQNQK